MYSSGVDIRRRLIRLVTALSKTGGACWLSHLAYIANQSAVCLTFVNVSAISPEHWTKILVEC